MIFENVQIKNVNAIICGKKTKCGRTSGNKLVIYFGLISGECVPSNIWFEAGVALSQKDQGSLMDPPTNRKWKSRGSRMKYWGPNQGSTSDKQSKCS